MEHIIVRQLAAHGAHEGAWRTDPVPWSRGHPATCVDILASPLNGSSFHEQAVIGSAFGRTSAREGGGRRVRRPPDLHVGSACGVGPFAVRILVVEDEQKVADALREGLEGEKYEVIVERT